MRPTLVIFARFPALGRVKTRLAAGIGDTAALAFHRTTLERTCRMATRLPWRVELHVTPNATSRFPRLWPRVGRTRPIAQGSGDLGARMVRAFARRCGPTLLVGCDIPEMTVGHLRSAALLLGASDAVFGPAKDGGFWLAGFRNGRLARRAFAGVRWSSPHALADCLANLRGRRMAFAHVLDDIDDRSDLLAWRRRTA